MNESYLLVTGDFVNTGGMDRANFALAEYLARQGVQVHLVAYRVAIALLTLPNVKFHRVQKLAGSYLLSGPMLNSVGRSQARRLRNSRVLVNGGNCQWGDVNWVHYVHAAYGGESKAGLLQGFKGWVARRQALVGERRALQSARVIIANSDRTKGDLIEKLGIQEQRIHRVYYGIDPLCFYPASSDERSKLRISLGWSQDKPIVVFMGALGDRRKGFDTLFWAWQQLCADSEWDADLVAIGSGAELPLWQKRVADAGIGSRIHFLGFRADVPDLLRAADCLVAPTRYEAYGLAVHEALCCGLPAIVTASAGVAERYSQELEDLLLSDPDDAADLAMRLRLWRRNMNGYSHMVNSFSEELRSYTWDDMAQKIVEKIEGAKIFSNLQVGV